MRGAATLAWPRRPSIHATPRHAQQHAVPADAGGPVARTRSGGGGAAAVAAAKLLTGEGGVAAGRARHRVPLGPVLALAVPCKYEEKGRRGSTRNRVHAGCREQGYGMTPHTCQPTFRPRALLFIQGRQTNPEAHELYEPHDKRAAPPPSPLPPLSPSVLWRRPQRLDGPGGARAGRARDDGAARLVTRRLARACDVGVDRNAGC